MCDECIEDHPDEDGYYYPFDPENHKIYDSPYLFVETIKSIRSLSYNNPVKFDLYDDLLSLVNIKRDNTSIYKVSRGSLSRYKKLAYFVMKLIDDVYNTRLLYDESYNLFLDYSHLIRRVSWSVNGFCINSQLPKL